MISSESPFKAEVEELLEASGVKASSAEILGPFSDLANRISEAVWLAVFPGSTTNSLSWPLLLVTAVITVVLWALRCGRKSRRLLNAARLEGILPSHRTTD